MSLNMHILTANRHVNEEVMTFDEANGEVLAGEWVVLSAPGEFTKFQSGDTVDGTLALAVIDSSRPDTRGGYTASINPPYMQAPDMKTIAVVRNWEDLVLVTNRINTTGLSAGDALMVAEGDPDGTTGETGGILLKRTSGNPIVGYYEGANTVDEYDVETGHQVKLKFAPVIS